MLVAAVGDGGGGEEHASNFNWVGGTFVRL